MRNISIFRKLLLVSLVAALFACDPFENEITPAYEGLPIGHLLKADSVNHSLWVEILEHTGLFSTMNLNDNYTAFVPNNEGVSRYLEQHSWATVADMPVDEAKYLVKYHTIRGKVIQQSFFDNGVISDTTATGDQLTIEIRGGGLNAIYVNGEARIAKLDVQATNGVVHVIEDVLTPVSETIWQKLMKPGYSLMHDLVKLTGFDTRLNTIYESELNPQTGQTSQRKRSYTFFAVPDLVFAAKGVNNLGELLAFLGETNDNYNDPTNKLYKFVAYHILGIQFDFNALATFTGNETSRNIQTLATNELINVSLVSDNLVVNQNISLTEFNINTKNGVMHVVNDLMPVITPPQTTVIWELTDYADVASLFSSTYRKIGSSTVTNFMEKGSVASYNWEAIPTDKNNRAVGYLIRGKSDNTYEELVNNDCLVLSLGLYGWVEMKTPAIIAGTYEMSVVYLSRAASSQYGRFITIFNGNQIGSEIATHGASAFKAEMRSASLGRVSFSETTTHTLRLLAADNSALYIDYIKFERVN